jgi:hypothetical protein
MESLRPLVAAVLGLMLCVQGLALAAAPVDLPADETASAMAMPCHGDSGDVAPCDCCDGDCPDMASCVIGYFFAAPPATPAPLAPAAHLAAATDGWSLKTAVLSLPVRPPIVIHA